MNKKQQLTALMLAMFLMLSGCSGFSVDSPKSQQQSTQQPVTVGQSMQEEKKQPLSKEKIPTEMESQGVFVQSYQDWDRESLPAQYLMEMDETAWMMVEQVQKVTTDTQPLDIFDGIEHAGTNRLLRVALEQTPAIDLPMDMEDGQAVQANEKYPNHVLTELLQNEQEEGRDLREFYYQEDVTAVYTYLFGEGRTLNFQDLCPNYYYYAREGVFAKKGQPNRTEVWPLILGYGDSKVSMTADVILTQSIAANQPLRYTKADGSQVELTAENYVQELSGEPVYRYTFDKTEDGHLVLDGIRCIGVLDESGIEIIDGEEPLQEETLQIEAPERVTVAVGEQESSIDLQSEYEGVSASYYLRSLLGDARKVENNAGNETLVGRGSAHLTLTLGYTQGEESVIEVYSQSYLPQIAKSYMLLCIGEENYVLPQDNYFLLSDYIENCKEK